MPSFLWHRNCYSFSCSNNHAKENLAQKLLDTRAFRVASFVPNLVCIVPFFRCLLSASDGP